MNKIKVIDIAFFGNSANADRIQDATILDLTAKIEKIVAYKHFTCIINDERTNTLYWCKIPVNRLLERFRTVGNKMMVAKPFSIAQAYDLIDSGKLVKLCNRDDIEKYDGKNYGVKVQSYLEKRFKIKFDKTVCDLDGAEWRGTEVKYWNAIKSSNDATFSSVATINDRYGKL
jgi:sugar lactone lactonase YvrE